MSSAVGQSGGFPSAAVLLTPPGSGAIAVIRLAGTLNEAFAKTHLSRPPIANRCVHADLFDAGQVIDDIVVVRTDSGFLDLNIHGGPYVTQAVLGLAERFGYEIGKWPDDDALNSDAGGEIERQMLIDLPRARSEAILRLLSAQPEAWRDMLESNDIRSMRDAVEDTELERALAIPTIAIVGPPNVGKSTLANALFGQERSITADRPGTTRDWVGELADLGGLVVRLIDTPGIRDTDDAIEAQAIRQAGGVIDSADCIIVAVDGSRPLDAEERATLYRWPRHSSILVRTKVDRPIQCDVTGVDVDLSAIKGHGIMRLTSLVRERLGIADLDLHTARCWTNAQRKRLQERLAEPPAGV